MKRGGAVGSAGALLMLLGGCSSSGGAASAGAPSSPASSAAAQGSPTAAGGATSAAAGGGAASYSTAKVCSLLSPSDIKTATGADVAAGAIGDRQAGLWVECRYYAGQQLLVRVQLAEPAHAQDAYTGNCQATDPATVPGADKGCWDSALGAVNVLKGGLELGVVYDDGTTKTDQGKTTALAAAALANVGKLG